jgi:hypothetical protein
MLIRDADFTSLWLFGKQSRGVHIGGHRVFHDLAAGVGNIGIGVVA